MLPVPKRTQGLSVPSSCSDRRQQQTRQDARTQGSRSRVWVTVRSEKQFKLISPREQAGGHLQRSSKFSVRINPRVIDRGREESNRLPQAGAASSLSDPYLPVLYSSVQEDQPEPGTGRHILSITESCLAHTFELRVEEQLMSHHTSGDFLASLLVPLSPHLYAPFLQERFPALSYEASSPGPASESQPGR